VIGLGCEGIAAHSIFQEIIDRGHSADVLTIQETGGTTLTAAKAAEQLRVQSRPNSGLREPMTIDQLIVGIGKFEALGNRGRAILDEILDRGGRVLKAVTSTQEETLRYAQPFPLSMHRGTMQALTG
ncbi:MAG: UxaA family hydrolase, partial [Firmicutes bacterium]|nr:UxaA family hydrolase [Bacillota bacterium]